MKLSIITVTYNSGKTLRDTIESVLSQTYTNYEYIIVDGASKDNTIDIIKEYEPKFNGRMLWISEPDKGLYDAMNKGIRSATGDIVGIINSDDFYHRSNILQIIAETFIKENSIQAVYGDIRFVNNNNLNKTVRYYSSKNFSPKKFRYGFMPAHPSFFTYKKYFDNFGYYKTDYKIAADFELLIRFLYTHKLKTKYIPLDFIKMRIGGISTASWRNNMLLIKEDIRACRENNIWTCMPLIFSKFFIKIFEFINTKQ